MTLYSASLDLAVYDHGKPFETFWLDPLWKLDYIDRDEYAREYAWFATEFDNPDYTTGAVLHYYRNDIPADDTDITDFGIAGETVADMAERCQSYGLDGPSTMDWNVGGITYVVDTSLSIYEQ